MDSEDGDQGNQARSPGGDSGADAGEDAQVNEQPAGESAQRGAGTDRAVRKEDLSEQEAGNGAGPESGLESVTGGDTESARVSEEQQSLDRALACFEAGNFALARSIAKGLLESGHDEVVRAQAEALLDRMSPDRLAIILGILCLVLIVVLGAVYL